jgi:uncharacterized protein YcgI (DUF1989 family)
MSSTADPKSAQAHARAQAGTRVESMPILPASDAPAPGVAPQDMLWSETIAPGGYASKRLNRGARLLIEDVQGDACVSILAFNAEQPTERLNVADTLKVQWNAYLGPNKVILSDMGRRLLSILEDDAQTHDAFCGPSTQASNAKKYRRATITARIPMRATASCWRWANTAWAARMCIPASISSRA